jgi:LuxR family transcriptional regulator, regulator of acetate metabolism
MMLRPDTARPDDGAAYRQALRLARDQTGVPLTFGGQLSGEHVVLEEFLGAQTDHLDGLRVQHGRGIGGYAVAELRPVALDDYVAAADITHDYDSQVRGEGIRAIVAAPVTVRGAARGVLYAAVRSVFPLGERAMVTLAAISRGLATEIAIRDEVDRRVRMLETAALVPRQSAGLTPGDLRDLREELLSIAGQLDDDGLRTRLRRACARLEQHGPAGGQADSRASGPPLSPRELDVLREVALGCSNAEAAQRLALRPETVKAYLRSASRKLGVHSRYQAVLAARSQGLLESRLYPFGIRPSARPIRWRLLPSGAHRGFRGVVPPG